MPKKLKFIQKGYQNYSGPIGKFTFVNGVSTEHIHRVDRDQLSAAFQFVEIDDDGTEREAGVAARLVADSAARMPTFNLPRQSDEEKAAEGLRTKMMAKKPDVELLTRAQLEEIASKHGIKGLRSMVSDKWGVKERSIPLLIDEVLVAQNNWISERNEKINQATKIETPVEPKVSDIEGLTDEQLAAAAAGEVTLQVDLKNEAAVAAELAKDQMTAADLAAATGDLGAALNQTSSTENSDAPVDPVVDPEGTAGAADPAGAEPAPATPTAGTEAAGTVGQDA